MADDELIKQVAKDLKVIRDLLSKYVNAQHEAESEIPEKLRRKMTDDPNNRWDHTRAIGGPK